MLIRKDVLTLTFPIVIEQTFIMLLGVCNMMMAGYIGEEAVSAIGMVDSINNMFISFFAALSVGATVVVAQLVGQKKLKEANETIKQSLVSGIAIATLITLFIWLFRDSLIQKLYGSAADLIKADAKLYIEFTLFTYPFIAIEQISNGILRGAGNTKTPMCITILMNVVNIILGYLLIYGIHFEFLGFTLYSPSLGITGAALAIAIARVFGTVVILSILIKGTQVIKLRNFFPFKINFKIQKDIFNIGIPAGVEQLLFNGGKLIVQIFIVTMGTISIASNTIGMSIASIINVVGNALALASTTIVGQYIGRNDVKEARSALIYLTKFATVCLVCLSLLFIPISPWVSSLYTRSEEVIKLSSLLIRTHSLAILVWPMSFVLSAGLKGAGDTRFTMLTAVIGMWLFRILTGYLLGIVLGIGVLGIWIGMYMDWIVRGILYSLRLKGENWVKHKIA